MGIAMSWIAVRGLPLESALSRLGLELTDGETDYLQAPLTTHPVLPDLR